MTHSYKVLWRTSTSPTLSLEGSRLIDLAASVGMIKQDMGDLVTQCEAWDMVQRTPKTQDGPRRCIVFTETGLAVCV